MKSSLPFIVSIAFACAACAPRVPTDTQSAASSASSVAAVSSVSSSATTAGWTPYIHPKGFMVMVPTGWKVDDYGEEGIGVYEPTTETFAPGDGGLRYDQEILFESGDIDAFVSALDASENGGCDEPVASKVGTYDAVLVSCVSVFDGATNENYLVRKGDMYFHFVSRMNTPFDDTMKAIRDSFRLF